MSIVPVSELSGSDLLALGNNVAPTVRRDRSEMLAAVNRSLAVHEEQIPRLLRPRPVSRPVARRLVA